MLQRPPDVGAGHHMRPRATGIWRVTSASADGALVTLADAYTGKDKFNDLDGMPDKISTRRLIRFSPNVDPALEESRFRSLERLIVGDYVAVVLEGTILLLRVESIEKGRNVGGALLRVPTAERHGGWARRPWAETEEEKVVNWEQLLGRVRLVPETACLNADSLAWLEKWSGGAMQ